MSPERYLLDTSALMALIEDEAGAERVEQIITQGRAVLPWPVLLEIYYIARQERGQAEPDSHGHPIDLGGHVRGCHPVHRTYARSW